MDPRYQGEIGSTEGVALRGQGCRDAAVDRLAREAGWRPRTTPAAGAIGYTGSYREPSPDVVEVSVISVLEARGPD